MKPDPIVFVPTREQVEALAVGDYALDCFGKQSRVTEIIYRGTDVRGRSFVGFYTEFGDRGGQISGSYKERTLLVTVPLSNRYTSRELDVLAESIGAERDH